MSQDTTEAENNFKDWTAPLSAALGLLVVIAGIFAKLTQDEQGFRSTLVAGYVVCVIFTAWLVFFKKKNIRSWRLIGLGVLYVYTAAFFAFVGNWLTNPELPSQAATSQTVGNLVRQMDLGQSPQGWADLIQLDENWTNLATYPNAAFPASDGERGAGYDLDLLPGKWRNYVIRYPDPIQADVITADFYLPATQDIAENWIGLQVTDRNSGLQLARSANPIPLGEWTRLILDLRNKYDRYDVALTNRPVNLEVFYGVKGNSNLSATSVRVRLDRITEYKEAGFHVGTRLEQHGADHLLFDFENEHLEDWQVDSTRGKPGIIQLSSARVFRGHLALKWEVDLNSEDKSFIQFIHHGTPPTGGWIARVYLPGDTPPGTRIWANFYTLSKSGWADNPPVFLTAGEWNTLIWDTHAVDWDVASDAIVGIQIKAETGSYDGPIFVDDIQVFER
ncbi:MAG: hypothetical protein K8J31_01635 [Anaerolineae bacterium]|nr:hypothetical protein [Anaerolineae bacterium]